MVLRPGDAAERHPRLQRFVIDAQPLQRGLYHGLLIGLVVDRKCACKPFAIHLQRFDVAPQHTHAEAMKGAQRRLGERAVAQDLVHPLGHLLGGFIGEGDRKDLIGGDATLLDQIGNAVRHHPRLARACTGQQQHRPVHSDDAILLLRVHVFKKVR